MVRSIGYRWTPSRWGLRGWAMRPSCISRPTRRRPRVWPGHCIDVYKRQTQDKTESAFLSEMITPIISEGDAIGAVLLLGADNKKMGETEKKLALTAAGFLGRQMED